MAVKQKTESIRLVWREQARQKLQQEIATEREQARQKLQQEIATEREQARQKLQQEIATEREQARQKLQQEIKAERQKSRKKIREARLKKIEQKKEKNIQKPMPENCLAIKIFAKNFKTARLEKKYSLRTLSKHTNTAVSYLSEIENSKLSIGLVKAEQLANFLNMPLYKLLIKK